MNLRHTANDFCSSMARMNTANPAQTPQRMEVGKMGGSDSNDSCGDARREKCFEAGASAMSGKRGRRSKYTAEEDLIILREVAATKAHIAPYGRTLELFQTAAKKVNGNAKFTVEATAKGIFDRYTRLQKDFDKSERKTCLLSGVGGEIGEAEELLAMMKEARDDAALQARMEKEALRAQEEAKIRKGEELVMLATERVPRRDDAVVEIGEGDDDARPKKKRRDNVRLGADLFTGEVDRFADSIRESDDARIALDRERLLFEQKRFEREMQEREKERAMRSEELEKDRAMRKEEREAHERMELEKFKLMLEVLRAECK